MDGLHCLGADEVGVDYGSLLQAAGGLASGGVNVYEQGQAEKKSAADEQKSVDAVLAADIAASNAAAQADISAQLKGPSASIDATAASMASGAQDKAGMGLSAAASAKRVDAAEKMLAAAIKNSQANPKDAYKAALVKAWTSTVNKAHSGGIVTGEKMPKVESESWLTKRVVGPIPGWGVLVGGAGLLTGIGFALKAIIRR